MHTAARNPEIVSMSDVRRVPLASRRLCVLALASAFLVGCANAPKAPPPPGLDLHGAAIVVAAGEPAIDISGLPGGKPVGAGVGAGTGAGSGVVVGAVGCLASGPFYALCLLAVLPATTAVGAATGAVVGAVKTESTDAMALKTAAVKTELGANTTHAVLAQELQTQLHDDFAIDLALASALETPLDAAGRPWQIDIALKEVGTEGKSEYGLRLVAELTLRRPGDPTVVYQTAKEVQSETELTTAAWTADDARAMRGVLNMCMKQVAHRLLLDLMPADASAGRPAARNKYSTSCDDVPQAWTRTATR
jgi:hypothetical protein